MNGNQRNAKRSNREWVDLIQECRTSGFGDEDWREQYGIPISSFYSKISRLRRKACGIQKPQRLVIREPQQVVPLSIVDAKSEPYIETRPSDAILISLASS